VTDAELAARALAQDLAAAGLVDDAWRAAFEQVPRHLFVPRFYDDDGTAIDGGDMRAEWLAGVYRDDSLITQVARVPGTDTSWPTSSSTRPSLMAALLTLLKVEPASRVLEIGTGTGYNAALLCHRLGDTRVTSIDIDPGLVDQARQRLADLGYRPHLVAGDGAAGVPDGSPYDRIIATCAVSAIPPAWITQLRAGGRIVTDLRGELAGALVVLTKTSPDAVTGHFTDRSGHFMWMRAAADNPLRDGGHLTVNVDHDGATRSTSTLGPARLHDPDLRLMLQLSMPDLVSNWSVTRDGTELAGLQLADGSWVEVDKEAHSGRFAVSQGGPQRVWRRVEAAAATWDALGRPVRSRLGLTAHADGVRDIWLDHPTRPVRLPAA
jgi:methyltransferase of ATP-grasp peptide maturase system